MVHASLGHDSQRFVSWCNKHFTRLKILLRRSRLYLTKRLAISWVKILILMWPSPVMSLTLLYVCRPLVVDMTLWEKQKCEPHLLLHEMLQELEPHGLNSGFNHSIHSLSQQSYPLYTKFYSLFKCDLHSRTLTVSDYRLLSQIPLTFLLVWIKTVYTYISFPFSPALFNSSLSHLTSLYFNIHSVPPHVLSEAASC